MVHKYLPLFDAYSTLTTMCPYIDLGYFPTPIERFKNLEVIVNKINAIC